jgi:hypothetical protein
MRRRSRNIPRMPITKNADSGRSPQYCPRNRISRPHCSARSCQGGFVVSTKVFFEAPKNPNLFEPLTLCHVERSRSECDDVVETSRECQSPKMQTQGVLPNIVLVTVFLVPIVPPDPAKAGSWFRPRFFSKRQRTLTFSSPSPSVMLSAVGANADDVVETSRECQSPKMQTQGVLPKDCPRNRISRPHCSARSCQRGFVVSTKVFFEAPKNPNLFEPLPSVMLSGVGANATT